MKKKQTLPEKEKSMSVRVSDATLSQLKLVKQHIGISIVKFIETAVEEKFDRLPKAQKQKMGVIE